MQPSCHEAVINTKPLERLVESNAILNRVESKKRNGRLGGVNNATLLIQKILPGSGLIFNFTLFSK
jgi:hypothetical protein